MLEMPMQQPDHLASDQAAQSGAAARTGAGSGPGSAVLVVEDEWWIADIMMGILEDAGYRPLGPVQSVAGGLALIEATPVDAALLDVNLGTEDSYPLADALIARGTPVLLVTGYQYSDLPERFRTVPLLSKPITTTGLLAALECLLASHARETER